MLATGSERTAGCDRNANLLQQLYRKVDGILVRRDDSRKNVVGALRFYVLKQLW